MKFKKNQIAYTSRDIDMTNTGGPNIPKGTLAHIIIRRRDGRLWVNVTGYGCRHLTPDVLVPLSAV